MASILSDINTRFKKPTHKWLINNGFIKIAWGSPKGRFKNGNPKWENDQKCYEYIYEDDCSHWVGVIYYYPESFKGYVKPFQGNWKDPKDPAGFAYITIDNRDDRWESIVPIKDLDDINLSIAIMKKRIKKLNKIVFENK